jgi:hypothetical protein
MTEKYIKPIQRKNKIPIVRNGRKEGGQKASKDFFSEIQEFQRYGQVKPADQEIKKVFVRG